MRSGWGRGRSAEPGQVGLCRSGKEPQRGPGELCALGQVTGAAEQCMVEDRKQRAEAEKLRAHAGEGNGGLGRARVLSAAVPLPFGKKDSPHQ